MYRDLSVAWDCLREAIRGFRWREYAPFGWILAAQLVVLLLALNLGASWGMGPVSAIAGLLRAEGALHYPQFFVYLPKLLSTVEAFLYVLPGSLLIPLSLIRVFAPIHPSLATRQPVSGRLRQAFLPTLAASLVSGLLLVGWQMIVREGPGAWTRSAVPGFGGVAAAWLVGALGAYAISAFFIYVPVAAVWPHTGFGQAVARGLGEGWRLFGFTILFICVFSLPALPFLLLVQTGSGFVVDRMQPELVALLWGAYAVLLSVASYLTYAAAARLHWIQEVDKR